MSRTLAFVAAVGLVCLVATSSPGGEIRKRGQKTAIFGEIQKVSKTEVVIKPKTKDAETVAANEIARIRFDNEPLGLDLARTHEEKGALNTAIEAYTKALGDPKASDANLKLDIEYMIVRSFARQALGSPSKRDEAIKKLDTFRKAHPDNFRYYEAIDFLAQVQMAKGDYDSAKTTFTEMENAPWSDYKMAAKIGNARVQFNQGQFGPALESFNAVVAMPGNSAAETSRKHEALLGKATCLQKQSQFEEAIKVLDEVIEKVSPEDKRVQAESYLRLGDCYQNTNKQKEAVFAYLHVDVLYGQETNAHAEALYHLSKLWATVGQAGRATLAAETLQRDYPDSDWAKKAPAAATE